MCKFSLSAISYSFVAVAVLSTSFLVTVKIVEFYFSLFFSCKEIYWKWMINSKGVSNSWASVVG